MSHRTPESCASLPSDDGLDFSELKKLAAEFYHANKVPEKIEDALNDAFFNRPGDVFGYLANYFAQFSAPPRISKLCGKDVYDARGQLSIQAEVYCIIRNEEERISSAGVSSMPESELWSPEPATTIVDQAVGQEGQAEQQQAVVVEAGQEAHVAVALRWVRHPLSSALQGLDPCEQATIDQLLSNFLMSRYPEEKPSGDTKASETPSEPTVEPLPHPPSVSSESKLGSEKKGKVKPAAKPIPPRVPEEPRLPGCMAISAVSLAVAKAGAQIQGTPLYKYIAALRDKHQNKFRVPMVLITLLSCGKSSAGKLNLLEDIILIPKAGQRLRETMTMALEIQKEITRIIKATSKGKAMLSEMGVLVASYDQAEQPLGVIAEACENLGMALGEEIHLAINCAAHKLMDYSKGKYEVGTGTLKTPDELVDLYQTLLCKYPSVVALIDPLRKEDVEQWEKLSAVIGSSCSLLSDISSTAPGRAPPPPGVNGYFLRHADETTISGLITVATKHPDAVMMGSKCSEACGDAALADVAVGLGVSYFRLGGMHGAERLAKYNRLISIEEELAQQGILGSMQSFKPPIFPGTREDGSSATADIP